LKARTRPGWRPLDAIDPAAPPPAVAENGDARATAGKATALAGPASPRVDATTARSTKRSRGAEGGRQTQAPPDPLDLLARSGADLADVPLALSTYTFDETSPGKARVLVAADLDLPPASGTGTEIAYRLLVVPLGKAEGLEHGGEQTLAAVAEAPWKGGFGTHEAFARAVEVAPGRYQARLAVEVKTTGRRGAATRAFDVPPLGGLRLSTPILTNRIQENGDRAPRALVRGLRAFWSNASLFCQYEVFGAAEKDREAIEAGYVLKAEDGTVARQAPATRVRPTEDGRVLRLFGFPLRDVPPGRYTLTLEARNTSSGATATASERFTILAATR
jgi:hypothetical protein